MGTYGLSYAYNLAGEVISITNPWGVQVGYNYDKTGRPTNVMGSGYGGVSSYVSRMSYRTFGLKQMNYSNGRTLSVQYDNRLRPTQWNIPGVMGWNYAYNYFNERTGRVMYAQNISDGTLDRSYQCDQVGRLIDSHSGGEARFHMGIGPNGVVDGPYSHHYYYDQWGNITQRDGWSGDNAAFGPVTYTNNKRNGLTYDAAGNLTNDVGLNYTYDATGQQATASYSGYLLQQYYDGNGLRGKKTENGLTTYYLRSSVLGGQVIAEIVLWQGSWQWKRGYVYLGGQLLAIQDANAIWWVHQDPIVKSKRVTNGSGTVVSTIELDPWGGNTNRNSNAAFQPQAFTTYTRDDNASDDAMFRRYNRWWSRFDQPDPYDGSYNLNNPQSFNRYPYVQNDPANFVDPNGLDTNYTFTTPDKLPEPPTNWTGVFGGGDTGIIVEGPTGGEGGSQDSSGFNIPGIVTQVNAILSKPACIDFAERILNAVTNKDNPLLTGGDLQQLFELFLVQKNGGYTRKKPNDSAGYGSPRGLIRNGNGKIFSKVVAPAEQTAYDAATTVAELFHLAGRNQYYTDRALAEAAHSIPDFASKYGGFIPESNVFDPRYRDKAGAAKDPNHGGWSSYFHDIQRKVCGP
jgi:RHS repeat-associated protein